MTLFNSHEICGQKTVAKFQSPLYWIKDYRSPFPPPAPMQCMWLFKLVKYLCNNLNPAWIKDREIKCENPWIWCPFIGLQHLFFYIWNNPKQFLYHSAVWWYLKMVFYYEATFCCAFNIWYQQLKQQKGMIILSDLIIQKY